MPIVPAGGAHPRHSQLAKQIVAIALARAWPLGMRLTEQDLAGLLDVSRTPIRAALRLLATLRAVQRAPSRGYVLALTGSALAAVEIEARPVAEWQLWTALIRDRLDGRLASSETQAEIARRYGVGVPVVQLVLRRMEQEGLVEHDGWRWTFVPTLETAQSRRASYELRLILEPAALLLPGFNAPTAEATLLADQHKALLADLHTTELQPTRIFDLDARFHETLAGFSGNSFLLNTVRQQNALRRLLEISGYGDRPRVKAWCQEHMAILAAIQERNLERASALMRHHLTQASQTAERASSRQRQDVLSI